MQPAAPTMLHAPQASLAASPPPIDVVRKFNLAWSTFHPGVAPLTTCVFRALPGIPEAVWISQRSTGPRPPWTMLEPYDAAAPWECAPDDVLWLVRCPACTGGAEDQRACDWAAASSRRCGAARAYIPPVHYGELPAPELATCLRDHVVFALGNCNVRSLLTFALDALERSVPLHARVAAQPFIERGHAMLAVREAGYGPSRFRVTYAFVPERPWWNVFDVNAQPGFGDIITNLVDNWRPSEDLFGVDAEGRSTVVFVIGFGGGYAVSPSIRDLSAWLDGGCNASLTGCKWLSGQRPHLSRKQRLLRGNKKGVKQQLSYPGVNSSDLALLAQPPPLRPVRTLPRVIVKSPPAFPGKLSWEVVNADLPVARDAGFEWMDAWQTSAPVAAFLGRDQYHFDSYNVSAPPGLRTAGPLTLALTNRLLEAMCGVLTEPEPLPQQDCPSCYGSGTVPKFEDGEPLWRGWQWW